MLPSLISDTSQLEHRAGIPPFVKWSGSKRQIAKTLAQQFPKHYRTYYEPFLGGGALLFYQRAKSAFASDIIPELIGAWQALSNPAKVADEYRQRHAQLLTGGEKFYYEVRDRFNNERDPHDFIFLSRTCYNGLIRFNTEGNFNVAFHPNRNGINPDTFESLLIAWRQATLNVYFSCQDYRDALDQIKDYRHAFVFLDPPYPGTKSQYTARNFNYPELWEMLEILNYRGVRWMLTLDKRSIDTQFVPSGLYKACFEPTPFKSAFRRLKNIDMDVTGSVFTNYALPELVPPEVSQEKECPAYTFIATMF